VLPDTTLAIVAAIVIFIVGCCVFFVSDTWDDGGDE
jgi:hypothetical protein